MLYELPPPLGNSLEVDVLAVHVMRPHGSLGLLAFDIFCLQDRLINMIIMLSLT